MCNLMQFSKQMWTVTNILICNLAFADLVISVFAVPFHFQAALAQRWDFARILCPICPFTQVMFPHISLCALCQSFDKVHLLFRSYLLS